MDIRMAVMTHPDLFSLKNIIIVMATASGYIKWMMEATPLEMFW